MNVRRILMKAIGLVPLLVCGLLLPAQTAPTEYTVTYTNSLTGPSFTTTVYRDGSRAIMDNYEGAEANPSAPHSRQLMNFDKGTSLSWNLPDSSGGCGTGKFSGDWGDPFANGDFTGNGAKIVGKETIQGFQTNIYQADLGASGIVKSWIDSKTGLVVKATLAAPSAAAKTIVEVKSYKPGPPPASLFVLSAGCAAAAAAPPPPTDAEKLAALTGGNAQDYVKAIIGPGSANSCTVNFRVVKAGTMEPVPSGFQVALDFSANSHHMPAYTFGVSNNGHSTFAGGELHEVTSQIHNGVLRIDNPPAEFELELAFTDGSEASGLIYRQCSSPQTTLLLVLKNPTNTAEGADFLWAKGGKYAAAAK